MLSVRSKKAIKKHQNYTVGITIVYLLFTLKKNPPSKFMAILKNLDELD